MSLFPAYTSNNEVERSRPQEEEDVSQTLGEYMETELLASDSEHDAASEAEPPSPAADFYLDTKLDRGNLSVSTLYYPGRPQYVSASRRVRRAVRRRRYFEGAPPPTDDAAELRAREEGWRRLLADAPQDEALWLRFVHFQETHRGGAEALAAAAEAAAQGGPRLRQARLDLAARLLPNEQLLALLREHLAAEARPDARLRLWLRLLAALAGADAVQGGARAALADMRAHPDAYPHIFFAYGAFLRSAGLWEQLVLLIELALAMNFPPSVFPPPADPARDAACEQRLLDDEDKLVASGMPLSAVWARVERLRALAHWRPLPLALLGAGEADPQRAPLPADVAELLLPAAAPPAALRLLLAALWLAKVPLLPACGWLRAAAGEQGAGGVAEALLGPLAAARRLPPAHEARRASPAAAAALLAHFVNPPHYFSDESGYLSWVQALWEACCGWTTGRRRVALLCYRLRWLHALMLLLDPQEESGAAELRRLRGEARAALRRHADGEPLPFALFARLELRANGRAPARRAALHALRAAARLVAPAADRLYIARWAASTARPVALVSLLTRRVCPQAGARGVRAGRRGGRVGAGHRGAGPRAAHRRAAARRAAAGARAGRAADVRGAVLGDRARAAAAGGGRRAVPGAAAGGGRVGLGARAAGARRLPRRAARRACLGAAALPRARRVRSRARRRRRPSRRRVRARPRAPLPRQRLPHALRQRRAAVGARVRWRGRGGGGGGRGGRAGGGGGGRAAAPAAGGRRARALGGRGGGAGGARGEAPLPRRAARRAAARGAPRGGGAPRRARPAPRALRRARRCAARQVYVALLGVSQWLHVRGAAWCGSEAPALADALLDKQLRLHALRDELEPLAPPKDHDK